MDFSFSLTKTMQPINHFTYFTENPPQDLNWLFDSEFVLFVVNLFLTKSGDNLDKNVRLY